MESQKKNLKKKPERGLSHSKTSKKQKNEVDGTKTHQYAKNMQYKGLSGSSR
jgi:hypothetical protein